jgi:predicted GNAT superfamily acetyltransferase
VSFAPAALADAFALNNAHAVELSAETVASFTHLVETASLAHWQPEGFVLAFDETAPRTGQNFLWFRARYASFVYVDRVVVQASARGRGVGHALYAQVLRFARATGRPRVVCEVNLEPPNPVSRAFHVSMGFVRVGEARLEQAGKVVEYLSLEL